MTGTAPELIAACWTSTGDVVPLRNGPTSPLDVRTRIRAVAEAGYTGFALTHEDLSRATTRGGTDYRVIIETLPLEHVFDVELDDGDAEPVGTLLEDTFDRRLPCGEGAFDVPSFINAVRDLGWTGPRGVEDMSVTSRLLPVVDALTRPHDGVLASFAEADRAGRTVA